MVRRNPCQDLNQEARLPGRSDLHGNRHPAKGTSRRRHEFGAGAEGAHTVQHGRAVLRSANRESHYSRRVDRARGRIAGRIRIPADHLLAWQPATACFRAMKECASPTPPTVMTIGHSTRPVKELIRLLKAHQVKRLVDVRTVPRSRHNPQFNRSALSPALHSARLHYTYMAGLGGFRRAHRDSLNTG